jgi:hypothetical protein
MSADSEEPLFFANYDRLSLVWIDVRIVLSVFACRVLMVIVAFLTSHTKSSSDSDPPCRSEQ